MHAYGVKHGVGASAFVNSHLVFKVHACSPLALTTPSMHTLQFPQDSLGTLSLDAAASFSAQVRNPWDFSHAWMCQHDEVESLLLPYC